MHWIQCWLYSFADSIETKFEEEDSLNKLKRFASSALMEAKVSKELVQQTQNFIEETFVKDLPSFCLRQFIDTVAGCVNENCFTESENAAIKRDATGPKANNKLYIATNATLVHTNRRFEKLERDSHKQLTKTAVASKTTSLLRQKLSQSVNDHVAGMLEGQWNASFDLDVVECE